MHHRIQFLRDSRHQPVGCLAIQTRVVIDGFSTTTLICYQMSVLNPKDNFDRPLARQLALGRMVEAPLTTTVAGAEPSMHEITEAIMRDVAADSLAPTRARAAARLW